MARVDKLAKDFPLDIQWLPFEVHPEIPPEGAVLSRDPERAKQHRQELTAVANEAGLEIRFRDRVSSSRLALELSEYARSKGKFEAFHRGVFGAYWRDARDIGDRGVLLEIGESIGLETAEMEQVIEKRPLTPVVSELVEQCHRLNIHVVPSFVFNRRLLLMGAQPYEVFKRVMEDRVLRDTDGRAAEEAESG